MHRRDFLRNSGLCFGIGLSGLSGCVSRNEENLGDVYVNNWAGQKITARIRLVRKATQSVLIDDTVTLGPDGDKQYSGDTVAENGEYRVEIEVKDGPSDSFLWKAHGEGNKDTGAALEVVIKEDEIVFSKIAT